MTEQATQAPAASVNGSTPAAAPAATEEGCVDCATSSERVMGVVGLVFAVGLAAIAFDLLTGGALSRAASGLVRGGEGDSDSE